MARGFADGVLFTLMCVGMLMFVRGVAAEGRAGIPDIPRGKGEQCVEPTDVMRRDHMRFLLHKRDRTVHEGVRTKQYSLKECIDCHVQNDASGSSIPVNAPGQFCAACHSYAAVNIDCFQCHATTPDSGAANKTAKPALSGLIGHGAIDSLAVDRYSGLLRKAP